MDKFISPKLLFITNRDDISIDYLLLTIVNKGIPYLRLNSEDITHCDISYTIEQPPIIHIKDICYSLSHVSSVYFRRAPTVFEPPLNVEDGQYLNRERKEFFEGLYLNLNCKWINPIFSTYIAERKVHQLHVANSVGFKTPNTLLTNSPLKANDFLESFENCIIKPISHGLQVTSETSFSIYTSNFKKSSFIDGDQRFESPILLQKRIIGTDIRAVVINDNIFCVEIIKDNPEEIDWRKPTINKKYIPHFLPSKVKDSIIHLHKRLDLIYSSIDFIKTADNEYVFLETNPAGEWVWLERECKLPISDTLISYMVESR